MCEKTSVLPETIPETLARMTGMMVSLQSQIVCLVEVLPHDAKDNWLVEHNRKMRDVMGLDPVTGMPLDEPII